MHKNEKVTDGAKTEQLGLLACGQRQSVRAECADLD